jgi:hypothetical protein
MDQELEKTCERCRQTDTTSFSTCRFCNTKYTKDSVKTKSSPNMLYGALIAVFFIGAAVYGEHYYQSMQAIYIHKHDATTTLSKHGRVIQKTTHNHTRTHSRHTLHYQVL